MTILDHNGLKVTETAPYDLNRKISVGTAQDNVITGSMSVDDAIAGMRDAESTKVVSKARNEAKRISERIEDILWKACKTGDFIVEDDDARFTRRPRMGQQKRKELVSELTKIYQKHGLADKEVWKEDSIGLVNGRKEMDKTAWRMAKVLWLPGWLFAGTFSQRTIHDLLSSSGLMPLDFDHVADVLALIEKLKNDPVIFMAAKSPSLTGVKSLIRIPDDAAKEPKVYLRCFQAMEAYLKAQYPEVTLGVDTQAKAVSQLMFFLHDKDAWCRPDSHVVLPLDEVVKETKSKHRQPAKAASGGAKMPDPITPGKSSGSDADEDERSFPFDEYPVEKQWVTVQSALESLEPWLAALQDGERYEKWTGLCFSVGHWASLIEDEMVKSDTKEWVLNFAEQLYGNNMAALENAFDKSDGRKTIASLFGLARDHGWQAPWRDDRPQIVLPSGGVQIRRSAEQIFKLIAPTHTLFNKGGHVVELCADKNGNPFLAPIKADEFRTRVEHHGRLMAWRVTKDGGAELKPAKLAVDDARAMLVSLEIKELPPISLITRCAVLTEDESGNLITLNNGYHEALGGVLVVQAQPVEEMPLEEAKDLLPKTVGEFVFLSEADRSRSLAARITPALRIGGFIKGSIPMECMEADEPQSGKGYSHAITTAIYNDQPHFVTQREGGVGSFDESLAQALISGHPFVTFDNVRGLISSPYLESFLTCSGLFFARIPGQREMPVDRDKVIILLTSNGMEATPDLVARSSICRIRKPKTENGEIIPYGGMPGLVKDGQAVFLSAVHAIIREWHRQGKPKLSVPDHDFHEWAGILGWMVEKLLGCAPLMQGHREIQSRAGDRDLSWLRQLCLKLEEQKQLGEWLTTTHLMEFCDVFDIPIPRVRLGTDAKTVLKIIGTRMAKVMGDADEKDFERYRISRELVTDKSAGDINKQRWFYIFERQDEKTNLSKSQ
jgi:hypothetical protein